MSIRVLLALIVGQVGIHAAMAGLRMAAPLQALREGQTAFAVGLLFAFFAAAPVMTAMAAGRITDRHGYHRPVTMAIALTAGGAVLAVVSTFIEGPAHFVLLCLAAMAAGTGANTGMIAIQRTAGVTARDATERMRIFSWLGVAPSFSNVVGPVAAGLMIDWGGFRSAYLLMVALTGFTVWAALQVPRSRSVGETAGHSPLGRALDLLKVPGMARLLLANWLTSTCWDAHSFLVPVIGHERGFTATTIGFILGTFTLSVSAIRLVIPLVAHRLDDTRVLRWAMWGTGLIFVVYPLAHTPWLMGLCAAFLGVTLGSSQPMVMTTLHHLTPEDRHGQALALRSMAINLSSTVMPLSFGVAGAAVGAAGVFWACGALVTAGGWSVRRYPGAETPPPGPARAD
jgi:MFS family permease